MHATGCAPFRWRRLSIFGHQARVKQPVYSLRNLNEKVPIKAKNFPGGHRAIPKNFTGGHSRGKRMGRHKRRPLGLSPIGLITNLLCPWPATGELVGSLTRMPPSARSPHTGAAASRWTRSRSSNSASNFPAPHPSPPWPAFNDCRMPTRFSSRIRSSSRMVRPAACLSD
jgi:hypothetical protein